MIEDDFAEKTCFDITKDIVDETLSAIFQIYLKDQLIPFTVHQASLCLMQYIDVNNAIQYCILKCVVGIHVLRSRRALY